MREKRKREGKIKEKREKESGERKEASCKDTQEDRIHQFVLKGRKPGYLFPEEVKSAFRMVLISQKGLANVLIPRPIAV